MWAAPAPRRRSGPASSPWRRSRPGTGWGTSIRRFIRPAPPTPGRPVHKRTECGATMLSTASARAARRIVAAFLLTARLSVALLRSTRVVYGRDLARELSIRYIHQYLGNASDNHDCGPAAL